MTFIGKLFVQIFGDSAADFESSGDQFASVNNWRRAHEEYEKALQKTPRSASPFRRVSAKLEEARIQAFESILEEIHSQIDVREFTYANELMDYARELAETSSQLASVEECEERLQGAGRYTPRPGAARPMMAGRSEPGRLSAARVARNPGDTAAHLPPVAPGVETCVADLRAVFPRLSEEELRRRGELGPRYVTAVQSIARGDFSNAVLVLEALHVENPQLGYLVYDLAEAFQGVGRSQEALALYRERMRQAPSEWRAPYEMAQCLWHNGAGDRALQVIESATRQHSESGHLMAQWGVLLHKSGSTKEALEKLYLALQLDEFDDAGLYHSIASFQCEIGEVDKAHRAYLKALEIAPTSVGSLLDYSEFLIEQKNDGRKALQYLDRAIQAIADGPGGNLYQVYAAYLSSRAHMLLGAREMALLTVTEALAKNDKTWLLRRLEDQRQAVLQI